MEKLQKLQKKGLTPRNWIIIGIMVSMMFVISATWITNWQGIYYANDSVQDLSSYNYISDLGVKTDAMQRSLSSDDSVSALGFLDFVVKGAYNALLAVLTVPNLFVALIKDMALTYGIPEVLVNGFLVLVAVALIFGIIGVVFRRRT